MARHTQALGWFPPLQRGQLAAGPTDAKPELGSEAIESTLCLSPGAVCRGDQRQGSDSLVCERNQSDLMMTCPVEEKNHLPVEGSGGSATLVLDLADNSCIVGHHHYCPVGQLPLKVLYGEANHQKF